MSDRSGLNLAVIGAGPAGLALALFAARHLPDARVTVFDARALEHDVARDARTLALSLGSVQLLERLKAWPAEAAQPILSVHVSQQHTLPWQMRWAVPEVTLHARDEGVEMLGAVLSYGSLVARLQRAWLAAVAREPHRLSARFGTRVNAVKPIDGAEDRGVEVDAGIAERFDLGVIAEGGVERGERGERADQARKALAHDYRQTAWVGSVTLDVARAGVAYERFTPQGPAALLPLPEPQRAALVWCVDARHDPVKELDEAQRMAVLNTVFHPDTGRIVAMSPLKGFPLGLNAERTLVQGRVVRIGNAAQTLHPVAGQGLNLGLRDAFELVRLLAQGPVQGRAQGPAQGPDVERALRRLEWQRAPDRWGMIAATDFLARTFTWTVPGLDVARGLGLAALQRLGPVKSLLAQRMMFGSR